MSAPKLTTSLPDRVIEDLVVAVLSVNSYPMEKTAAILPALRDAGLTNPSAVVGMTMETLTVRLNNSGYDRGMLVGRMAERLADLMAAVAAGQLDQLSSAIAEKNSERIAEVMLETKGIGKKVVQNACLLFFS